MARLVVAAAAGIITALIPGGQAFALPVFTAVYGATGFLDPNTKYVGPRLTDLSLPKANYGAVIPYIEGHQRTAGQVVWMSPKRTVKHEASSGKGGPGVDSTTFSYEMDVLILTSENALADYARIWSNGKLIFNKGEGADGATREASNSTQAWRAIRFYSGSDTQLPDPVYEDAVGVGHAPAYRGRAGFFIEGLNLGNNGQISVIEYEVTRSALALASAPETFGSFANALPWPSPMLVTSDGVIRHFPTWTNSYASGTVIIKKLHFDGTEETIGTYNVTQAYTTMATGQADVSCLVTGYATNYPLTYHHEIYDAAGFGRALPGLAPLVSGSQLTFAVKDGAIFGSNSSYGSEKRIFKADTTTGTLLATSPVPPNSSGIQSIAVTSTRVYAASYYYPYHIYEFALADLAYVRELPVPGFAQQYSSCLQVMVDDDDTLYAAIEGQTFVYDPVTNVWTLAIPTNGNAGPGRLGGGGTNQVVAMKNGILYHSATTAPNSAVWRVASTRGVADEDLRGVVERQCTRARIPSGNVDASVLAGTAVRGFAISQLGAPRSTLDMLASVFAFESVESSAKLKMVRRGGAPVTTIPYSAYGASNGDAGDKSGLPRQRANVVETPSTLSISFANVGDAYQQGVETSDRLVTDNNQVTAVEVPIVLSPTEGKRLAARMLLDTAASSINFGPITVSRFYEALEPTDVVLLEQRDGRLLRGRIKKRTDAGNLITLEGVVDDASAIISNANTSNYYTNPVQVVGIPGTTGLVLDIPMLRAEDDDSGMYAVGRGSTADVWNGYSVWQSQDNISGAVKATGTRAAVIGTTSVALGNWTEGAKFDELNSVTVNVGAGSLFSTTRAQMLVDSTVNACAIGVDGRWELLQFRDAVLISPGVYTLTGLLRGLLGTEQMAGTHAGLDSFVLLEAPTLLRLTEPTTEIGHSRYFRFITIGKNIDSVSSISRTDNAVALRPYAPADLRIDRSASPLRATWNRRSRFPSTFLNTVAVPLGETTESYDVELRNASAVLVASETIAVPYWDLDVSATTGFTVTVYQNSTVVGRGSPASTTLL